VCHLCLLFYDLSVFWRHKTKNTTFFIQSDTPQAKGAAPMTLMQSLDKTHVSNYGKESYWRERYDKDGSVFEWFVTTDDIKKSNPIVEQLLQSRIKSKARVLEIGCGTSQLAVSSTWLWVMTVANVLLTCRLIYGIWDFGILPQLVTRFVAKRKGSFVSRLTIHDKT
jgi:hypothetical protein